MKLSMLVDCYSGLIENIVRISITKDSTNSNLMEKKKSYACVSNLGSYVIPRTDFLLL